MSQIIAPLDRAFSSTRIGTDIASKMAVRDIRHLSNFRAGLYWKSVLGKILRRTDVGISGAMTFIEIIIKSKSLTINHPTANPGRGQQAAGVELKDSGIGKSNFFSSSS
jgi:hypothetical protein